MAEGKTGKPQINEELDRFKDVASKIFRAPVEEVRELEQQENSKDQKRSQHNH